MVFVEPNFKQWDFIGRVLYWSVVGYFALFCLATLHDVLFSYTSGRRKTLLVRRSSLKKHTERFLFRTLLGRPGDKQLDVVLYLVRFALNIAASAAYVAGTFRGEISGSLRFLNIGFGVLFVVDIFGKVAVAESARLEVLSLSTVLEAFSIPSLFLASGRNGSLHLGFLRAYVAYTSYRALEVRIAFLSFSSKKLITRLFLKAITILYLLSAGVQVLEVPGDVVAARFNDLSPDDWHFFNSLYFTVVTLTTVGYGDFSPLTVLGRLYVILMIIVGVIVFTNAVSQILENAKHTRGSGSFFKRPNARHVIVSGSPQLSDVIQFISAFYAPSRLSVSSASAKVVFLVEKPPWTDAEWYQKVTTNQFLQHRVFFRIGSVRVRRDLERVRLESADAIFLVASICSGVNLDNLDAQTVMDVLAIRNFRTDIPIYTAVLQSHSQMQADIAQRTPSSDHPELLFRMSMDERAKYPGIRQEVVHREITLSPDAFHPLILQKGIDAGVIVSRLGELSTPTLALNTIIPLGKDTGDKNSHDAVQSDLDKCKTVCLEDFQAALIAGHVHANGIGTLLTNMVLDVNVSPSSTDPIWLAEYKMGAMCNLVDVIIPPGLHDVQLSDICATLLEHGVVILALSLPGETQGKWPVLDTKIELKKGSLATILTYHAVRYVNSALYLAALRHQFQQNDICDSGNNALARNELELSEAYGNDVGEAVLSPDTGISDAETKAVRFVAKFVPAVPKNNSPYRADGPRPVLRSGIPVNDVFDEDDSSKTAESESDGPSTNLDSEAPGTFVEGQESSCVNPQLPFSPGVVDGAVDSVLPARVIPGFAVPVSLRHHIIISIEGEFPLQHVGRILKYLWRSNPNRTQQKRRLPVVLIHASFNDCISAAFARYAGDCLFFVQGNVAERATWTRAILRFAKGVVVLTDFSRTPQEADSRTIFSLMTLDNFIQDDQDVFVLSELVDENSLEFLREPARRRRIGMTGDLTESCGPGLARSKSKIGDMFTDVRYPTDAGLANQPSEPLYAGSGASRFLRGNLFSRARYASGDLLVHSAAYALLIREYTEPGFIDLYTSLIGGRTSPVYQLEPRICEGMGESNKHSRKAGRDKFASSYLKIRLVRIPIGVFCAQGSSSVAADAGVAYRIIFKALVDLGATPLGLYRSGGCQVKLLQRPFERQERGADMERLCQALLTKYPELVPKSTAVAKYLQADRSGLGKAWSSWISSLGWGARSSRGQEANNASNHESSPEGLATSAHGHNSPEENNSTHTARGLAEQTGHEHHSEGSLGPLGLSFGQDKSKSRPLPTLCASDSILWAVDKTIPGAYPTSGDISSETPDIAPSQTATKARLSTYQTWRRGDFGETHIPLVPQDPGNKLPYVLTMPEPDTVVSPRDGVFILLDPKVDLPTHWGEGYGQGHAASASVSSSL